MKYFETDSFTPVELLRALVENTTAAVFIKDRDGRYLLANRTCEALFGVPRRDFLGKTDREVLPAASAALVRANDEQVMTSGASEQFEEIVEFPSGPRVFLSNKTPLYDQSGRLRGVCAIAVDITERYHALHASQEQLREQARELAELHQRKDEFLAVLAHELRNPLAPIRHAAELMSSPRARADKIERAATVISRQVGHMARLVDDLMDAARLSRGRIELRATDVDIASVFERAREMIEPELRSRGHRLEVSLADPKMTVHGDPDRLVQIVGNLLENAARYSDQAGTIWLAAHGAGDRVRIVVRDQGQGITADRLTHLFEPFAREGVPHKSASHGLGLGLMIVKQLVDLHGGTIEVDSAGPGEGSQFTIELGLAAAEQPEPEAAAAVSETLSPRRILVVDDNEDAAELLAAMLEMDGHQVSVCFRGLEVEEQVRQNRVNIVLLDIGLPDLDGYQVAERLRAEHGAAVRLIAVTGYGQDSDRERSRQAGFDHHLVKPMDFAQLRSLLTSLRPARGDSGADRAGSATG